MILAYGTGCGKTPTAIVAIKTLLGHSRDCASLTNARILVICPAIVRRHWANEFDRWAGLCAAPIEMGRARKTGSKKSLRKRDEAYAHSVQVVSYDLAGEVDAEGWDFIVFDEVHHLSDCTSKQSRTARALMRANPGVPALGLSATLIPTELWQLWHPMWLLFGNSWGAPPKAGKICWDFVGRYCEVVRNEYGCAPGKPRASRLSELRNRLARVSHRLTREDIADDLPAIDCSVLDVPGESLARGLEVVGKAPRVRPEVSYAVEWYKALENDVHHAVVLVYHRDIGRAISEALRPHLGTATLCVFIDGSMSTAARVEMLAACEAAPRAVVVATSESIREGIRLMWAQKVLYAEWRQSPKQVLQTLGRFNSVGDRRRPQIQVLADESLYGASRVLLGRMAGINDLIKEGAPEAAVQQTFDFGEMSEARMGELTRRMIAEGPRGADAEWHEESGDEDEW